jgi:hypothetical protein
MQLGITPEHKDHASKQTSPEGAASIAVLDVDEAG